MLQNYIKVAIRNLLKHPGYTLTNIFGLALGLTCSILILLWVRDELSYDRHFENADRIYRVYIDGKMRERLILAPISPPPLGPTMKKDYPEVVASARMLTLAGPILVKRDDRQFIEDGFFFADSSVFDVFSFQFIDGDPHTALREPNTVVLTEAMAQKYFPEGNAVGKVLITTDTTDFRITGVIKNIPKNTHFHPNFLASLRTIPPFRTGNDDQWLNNSYACYILLAENASATKLEAKMPEMIRKYAADQLQQFLGLTLDQLIDSGDRMDYKLQALTDIHLHSHMEFETEANGNITYVYLFAAIAFFILLIACINFMNLATARSAGRAREVGMRKVLGSGRRQLVAQFLSESVILSVAALLIAVVAVLLVLPSFNNFTGKGIGPADFLNVWTVPVLLGLIVGVGLLAGSYPAFFLSGFKPLAVLKGRFDASANGIWLRRGLVVFQFAISIALIVCTIVVFEQLNYVRSKELGWDKEHVLVVRRADQLGQQTLTYKEEIRKHPKVVGVGASNAIPGGIFGGTLYRPEGANSDAQYMMSPMAVDYDWVEAMGITMADGRDFSRDFPTDTVAFVLNEAAVRKMDLKEPVGHRIEFLGPHATLSVIGVMKDFHFASLHREIQPLALTLTNDPLPFIAVRVRPEDISGTLAFLEEKWKTLSPDQPFEYSFLDEDFDELYKADQQLGYIFTLFAGIAIFVACLGLFGLASYMTQQRTKEIGVRKSLGATVPGIVVLLSTEFTKLVAVSFVVAAPVSYFAMNRWLTDFAYHTEIGVFTFVAAGLTAFLIAWFTVSYQSIKAANTNPVQALRYE